MPLKVGVSPETFSENVSAERDAGRPLAQSVAIAYAKKREALRRKKLWHGGYAAGGAVAADRQDDDLDVTGHYNTSGEPHTDDLDEETHPMEFMAMGGLVEDDDEDDDFPGATTRDVLPERQVDPLTQFSGALRRRARRFTP